MKKIMILGASVLQLPAIIKASQMGLQTIAVDMDNQAIGFKYADICLQISTTDVGKIIEAAKLYDIDGIMTLASDMPMRAVGAVVDELDLAGINESTALKATNKAIMRQCFEANSVPIPKYFCVNDYDTYSSVVKDFNDRFIVKPVDNSGSRGVFLVENKDDADYAYKYSKKYSRSGDLVVESFMNGPEVSVESISIQGITNIIAITDKLTTGAPKFVEMGHSQPTRHSHEIAAQIEQITKSALKAIGIENSPSHTEIIITKDGPKIVELGARLGGDNITTHLVPLSTGIDMVKASIEIALGEKPNLTREYEMGSAIRYFKTPVGKIKSIERVYEAEQLPGVKQISFVKNIGDYVSEIGSSNDRIGFVIAQSHNAESAISICEEVMKIIQISIV